MKRTLALVLALVFCLALLAGCGSSSTTTTSSSTGTSSDTSSSTSSAADTSSGSDTADTSSTGAFSTDEVFTFSMQITWPVGGTMYNLCYKPWVDAVYEATNGQVVIEIYGDGGLVDASAAIEGLRSGILDICELDPPVMPGIMNLWEIANLHDATVPFGKEYSQVMWNLYKDCQEEMEFGLDGLEILYVWAPGPTYYFTSDKPIRTADDLNGLVIWAAGEINNYGHELAGVTPVTTDQSEKYTSMEKGVVDGVAMCSILSYDSGIWSITKYANEICTGIGAWPIAMSSTAWDTLPEDLQEAVMSVSGDYAADLFDKGIAEGIAQGQAEYPDIEWIALSDEEAQKIVDKVNDAQFEAYLEYCVGYGFEEETVLKVYDRFCELKEEYLFN